MLLSWKAFKLRTNGKKEYLLKKYYGKDDKMTEAEQIALQQFTEANSFVQKIVDRYHLQPQNIAVDLFRSKDDTDYKIDATHLGWEKAAKNGITIHEVPGNHLDIVAPPNDIFLAGLLQEILNKRHQNQ